MGVVVLGKGLAEKVLDVRLKVIGLASWVEREGREGDDIFCLLCVGCCVTSFIVFICINFRGVGMWIG